MREESYTDKYLLNINYEDFIHKKIRRKSCCCSKCGEVTKLE